jgi:hypothetical protein
MYFVWDAKIFNRAGTFLISISNDEIIDIYANEPNIILTKAAFSDFHIELLAKTTIR